MTPHNLKPDIAEKLHALLLELYNNQTRNTMCRDEGNGFCYCIEGAVCELYRRETSTGQWLRDSDSVYAFKLPGMEFPQGDCMPNDVADWALDPSHPATQGNDLEFLVDTGPDGREKWVSGLTLNDEHGWNFGQFMDRLRGES